MSRTSRLADVKLRYVIDVERIASHTPTVESPRMLRRVGFVVLAASGVLAGCTTYLQDFSAADPAAKVPSTKYESMVATYRSAPEIERPSSWQAANEQQLRLGGHRGHLDDAPEVAMPAVRPGTPTDRAVEKSDAPAVKIQ